MLMPNALRDDTPLVPNEPILAHAQEEGKEDSRVRATSGYSSVLEQDEGAKDEQAQQCPWCHNHLGHHDHIFWDCPQRPPGPDRPTCVLQARLGWPMAREDTTVSDEAVMNYMTLIAKRILDERYRPGGDQHA